MINRVILVGRLTRDPELRRTASEISVASFTVAVDNWAKSGAEKSASFIPCTAWKQTAEYISKYARKGSLVGIDGRLNQRSYDSKEGKRVSILEVVCESAQVLEPKSGAAGATPTDVSPDFQPDEPARETSKNLSSIDIVDDDLPF